MLNNGKPEGALMRFIGPHFGEGSKSNTTQLKKTSNFNNQHSGNIQPFNNRHSGKIQESTPNTQSRGRKHLMGWDDNGKKKFCRKDRIDRKD